MFIQVTVGIRLQKTARTGCPHGCGRCFAKNICHGEKATGKNSPWACVRQPLPNEDGGRQTAPGRRFEYQHFTDKQPKKPAACEKLTYSGQKSVMYGYRYTGTVSKNSIAAGKTQQSRPAQGGENAAAARTEGVAAKKEGSDAHRTADQKILYRVFTHLSSQNPGAATICSGKNRTKTAGFDVKTPGKCGELMDKGAGREYNW